MTVRIKKIMLLLFGLITSLICVLLMIGFFEADPELITPDKIEQPIDLYPDSVSTAYWLPSNFNTLKL